MIEVKNLTKKYGSFTAVKNLNLKLEKGHIYGLLGPNGAGKSTTMNIMTGCLAATEGTVTVNEFDIYDDAAKAKKCIGYLPEIPPLYNDMTPFEYLRFVGRSKKIDKTMLDAEIERVMNKCGIENVADRLIKNLSKGYKQRVGIAQALIGDPEIIILDEPTVGLDPIQLVEIRELIRSLRDDHDVILSSHIMGEITAVCDYIIIIAYGRVVAEGTLEELENSRGAERLSVTAKKCETSAETLKEILSGSPSVMSCDVSENGGQLIFKIREWAGSDAREEVFGIFSHLNTPILEMKREGTSLESLFINLTSAPAPSDDADATSEAANQKRKAKKFAVKPSLGSPYLDGEETEEAEETEKNKDKGAPDADTYKPLFSDDGADKSAEEYTRDKNKKGE